jgi:recombination protein RecR
MAVLPKSVEKVIQEFERLPGVGPKSAARMAYFLLRAPAERSRGLADALVEMKEGTVTCQRCYNVSDRSPCQLCSDPGRDQESLCIVEEPLDVVALERSGVYSGVYFVLGGVMSPADGIGPEQLRMKELKARIKEMVGSVKDDDPDSDESSADDKTKRRFEVLIATNPSLEGEATASYILDMLREIKPDDGDDKDKIELVVSRLAMGLPTGADLEYADRLTLKRAVEGRTTL